MRNIDLWIRPFTQSLADTLMFTPVLAQFECLDPQTVLGFSTRHPAFLEGFTNVQPLDWDAKPEIQAVDFSGIPEQVIHKDNKTHLVNLLLDRLGMPRLAEINLELCLEFQPFVDNYTVAIAPGINSGVVNKQWPRSWWAKLVELISPHYNIVQLGYAGEEIVNGVENLALVNDPIRLIEKFRSVQALISVPNDAMYIANGLGVPSFVIYGGSLDPQVLGFDNNLNAFYNPAFNCAPCYIADQPCPFSYELRGEIRKPCMDKLTPEFVWSNVQKMLDGKNWDRVMERHSGAWQALAEENPRESLNG